MCLLDSDHSMDGIAAISSVALGASIIKSTLHYQREVGPDHSCSMEPDEFRSYVASLGEHIQCLVVLLNLYNLRKKI